MGTGVQLWAVCFLVLFFSMARLVSPLHRGNELTAGILIYVLTGSIAGYNAARIHRKFRGTEWLKASCTWRQSGPLLLVVRKPYVHFRGHACVWCATRRSLQRRVATVPRHWPP